MKPMLWLVASGIALGAAASSGAARVALADRWSLEVVPVTSPAGANSAQPQLATEGNRVVLSWIERSGENATLRFSERTDTVGRNPAPSHPARIGLSIGRTCHP